MLNLVLLGIFSDGGVCMVFLKTRYSHRVNGNQASLDLVMAVSYNNKVVNFKKEGFSDCSVRAKVSAFP